MYDQTGKLWFKIIAFIVLEAFLFTIADVSWAANYRDQRGSQQMALDSQKNKKEKDNVSADALSNQLVLTQPAMPYMGFGQITPQGQQGLESISLIDTTISGLSIAGNDLSDIFTTLKSSGCSVSEAGFGAMRQGFAKKEIYHALISAGYDKDEVKTLLGSLLKMESETKKQDEAAVQTKTGPPQEQSEQDKTQLNQKKAIFEIPSVTDLPIEKDVTKIVEKTVQQGAVLRQTVEFVRLMINEGKRGKELIKILKKAGLSNERITTALSQLGFNLKDIITILKDSNISCTDIVQAIYNSQVNYSDKDIYTALLKAGFSDQEIINALRNVGMNAADILKLTTELGRSMTQVADAMVKAGFNVAEIATAYVLKAMQWTWDNSVNVINCAVKAFDAFLNNVGRKFSSKQDLAYELIVDDILATGEVLIQNQDVMTSMVAIKNVAQNHGIDLEGYNLSLNSLLELEGVSVVHLDGDHWVTLVGIDGDQVTIIDNGTEEVISLSEFQIRWDGNVLAFNQQEISQDKLIDLQMREIRGGRGLLSVLTLGLSDVVEKVVDVVVDVVKKVWDVIKVVVIVVVAAVLTYVTAGALAPVFVAAFAATTAVAVAACTALAAAVASFAVTFCMGVLQGQSFGEAFKSALIAGVVAGIASGISSYANFSSPTGTPTTTGGTSFGGSEAAVSGTTGGAGAGAGAGVGAATGSVASSAGGTILGVSTVSIANAAISAVKQTVVSYALTKLMDAAGIDNVYLRAGIVGAAGAWAGSSAGTLSVENGSWSMATGELMTSEIAKQMLTGAATQISMEAIKQQGYKQGWDPLLTDGLSLTVGTFANIATSSALDIYNGKEINTTKFTNPAGDRFDTNFSNLFVQNFKSSVGELMGALASKAVDRICLQNNVDPILSAGLSSMSTSLFTSLTNFAVNDSDFGMTDIGNALRKGAGSAMDAGYKDYLIRDLGYTQAEATQTAYGTSLVFNMFSQNLEKGTSPTLESTIQSLFNDGVKSLGFTNEYNGSSYNQTKYLDTFDSEIDTLEYMMYASDAGITLDDNGVYRNSDGSENTYMNRNKARTEYNQYWKEKNPEVFDRSSGTATASTGNLSFADAWTKTLDTRNLSNMATQSAANFSSGVTNLQTSLDVISINAATMNTGVAASFGYNGVIQLSLAQGTNVNPAQAMQNLLNYGQNATKIYGANGKQIVGLMFENSDAFFRNKASAYQAVDTSTPWIRNQRVYTSDTAYKDVGVQANSIKDLVSNQNLSLVSYSTNSFQTDLLSMAATSSFAVNGSVVYDQLNNIFMLQNATFTSDSKQETVDFSTKLSNGDKVYFSVQSGNGFNNAVLKTSAAKDAAVYTTRVDGVAKELKIGDITSKASDKVSSLEVALTVSASGNLNLESASLKDANKILASENKLAAEIINLPSGCIVGNTTLELANSTNGLAVTAVENIDSNRSIKYSGEDAKITSKAQFVYNRDGKITSIVNKDISGKNLGVDIQTQKGSITLFDNQISFANQNNSLLTNLGSFFGMSSAEEFTIIKGEALAATNYQIINSVEQQQSGAAGGAGEAPGLNKIILIGDANGNQYIQQGSMFTIENNNWAVKDNDVIHNNSGKTITVSGKAFENGEIAAVHKGNIFKATVADDVKDRENIEYKLDVSGFNLNPLNIIQVADTVVSLPIGVMNANDIYLTDSGALTITQNIALQGPDVKGLYISAANTTFTLNSDGNQALKTEFSQIGLSGTLENQGAAGLKVGSNQLIGNTQVVDNNLSTTTAESNKIKINVTEDASYYQGGQVTLTNSGLVYKPSDILEITGLGSSAPNFNANTELYSGSFVSVGNLKLTTDGSYKITQNSVMTTNADSKILITLLNQSGQNVDTIMNLQEVSIPETNKTVEYSTPDFQNFSEATAGMSFSTQGIEFTIQDKGLNKFEARSQPISAVAAIELKNKDSISSKIDFKENVELTISPLGSIVTADNVTFNQVNTLKSGAEVKVNQDKSVEIVSGQINLAKADALKGQNSVATIQPDKNKEQNKKDNDTKPVYVGEAKIDLLGNNKYDLYGDLSFNKDSGVYLADNTKVTINNLAKDGKDFVNIGNTRAVAGTFGVSQGQITAIAGGAKLLEHITKSGEYITLEYKGTKQVSGKSIDQGWKINASQAAIDSKESWSGTIQGQSVNYSLAKKNNETIIQINNGAGVELKNQTLIGYGNQELKNVTVFATQKLANGNFVYTTTDEKAIGFQQLQSTSAGGPASQMLGKTIVSISDSFDNGQRIRTYGAQTNGAFCLTFTADKELKGINVAEQLAGSSLEIVGSGAKVNGETFLKGAISYNWNGKEIASSYSKGTTLLEANTSYGQVTREYLGADSWKFNASQSAIDNKAVWKGTYRNQSVDYNVADKNGETIIQINKGLGLKVENQTIVGYGKQELKNVDVTVTQKLANGQFVYTTTDKDAIGLQQLQSTSAGGAASQMQGRTIASVSDSLVGGKTVRTYGETSVKKDGINFALTFTADQYLSTAVNVSEQLAGSYLEIAGSGAKIQGKDIISGSIDYAANDKGVVVGTFSQGSEQYQGTIKGTNLKVISVYNGTVNGVDKGWTMQYQGIGVLKEGAAKFDVQINGKTFEATLVSSQEGYSAQINQNVGMNKDFVDSEGGKHGDVELFATQLLASGNVEYMAKDKGKGDWKQEITAGVAGAQIKYEGANNLSVKDQINADGKTIRTYTAANDGNFQIVFVADRNLQGMNIIEKTNGSHFDITTATVEGKNITSGSIDYASTDKGEVVGTFSQGTVQYLGTTASGNKVTSVYNGKVDGVDKDWTMQYEDSTNAVLKKGDAQFNTKVNGTTIQVNLVGSKTAGYQALIDKQSVGFNRDFTDSQGINHGDVELFATQLLANGNFEFMATSKGANDWKQEISSNGVAGAQIKYEGANNLSVKDQINADGKTIRTYTAANDGNFQIVFVADRNLQGMNIIEKTNNSHFDISTAAVDGKNVISGAIDYKANADGQIAGAFTSNTIFESAPQATSPVATKDLAQQQEILTGIQDKIQTASQDTPYKFDQATKTLTGNLDFGNGIKLEGVLIKFSDDMSKITQAKGDVFAAKGTVANISGQSLNIENIISKKDDYLGQLSADDNGMMNVTVDQNAQINVVSTDKKNDWMIQGSYQSANLEFAVTNQPVNAVFAITNNGLVLNQGVYTVGTDGSGYIPGNNGVTSDEKQPQQNIEITHITNITIEGNAQDGYSYTGTVEVRDFKALIFNTNGASLTAGTAGVKFKEDIYNKGSVLIGNEQGELVPQTGATGYVKKDDFFAGLQVNFKVTDNLGTKELTSTSGSKNIQANNPLVIQAKDPQNMIKVTTTYTTGRIEVRDNQLKIVDGSFDRFVETATEDKKSYAGLYETQGKTVENGSETVSQYKFLRSENVSQIEQSKAGLDYNASGLTNSGSGVIGINEIKTLQNQIGVQATGSFDQQTYNALLAKIENPIAGAENTAIAGTAFTMFMSETQQNKYAETINTFSANMPEKKSMSSSTEINSNGTKGTLTTSAEGVKFVGEKYAFQQGLVATNATIVFKEGKITEAQGSVYVSKGLTTDVNGQSLTIENVKGTKEAKEGYIGQLSADGSGMVSVAVDKDAKIQVTSANNNWVIQGSYQGVNAEGAVINKPVNAVFTILDKGLALKQGVYIATAGAIPGNKEDVSGKTVNAQQKIESTNITNITIEGNAQDGYSYTGTVEVRDFKALIFNADGASLTAGAAGVKFGEDTYNKGSVLIGNEQGKLVPQTGATGYVKKDDFFAGLQVNFKVTDNLGTKELTSTSGSKNIQANNPLVIQAKDPQNMIKVTTTYSTGRIEVRDNQLKIVDGSFDRFVETATEDKKSYAGLYETQGKTVENGSETVSQYKFLRSEDVKQIDTAKQGLDYNASGLTNSGSGVIGVNEIKTLQNQIGVKATGSFDDQTYNALITNIDNLGTTAGADKTVIAGTAFTMFMSETQQNKYAETINTFSANMPEKKIMSSSTEINSNGTKGTLTTSAEGVKFVGEKYAFQQGLVATNATIVFKEGKITQAQGSVYVSKGLTTDVNGQSLTIDNVKGTKDGYLGQLSVEGSGLVSVTVDQSAKIQVVSEDKKNNWIIQGSYKGVNAVFAITDKGLALKQGVYTASAGYIAGNKDNVAGATSQQQNKIESTNITDIVIEGNAKDGYAYTGTVEVRDFKALIFNTQGAKLTVGTNGVQFGEYTYNKGSELIGDKQGQLIAQTGAGTMNVTIGGTKATADFFVKETGIKTLTKLQGDLTTTKPVSLKNEYAGTDTYKAGSNLVLLNGELAIMGSGIRTIKANDLDASVNFKTDSITGNMTFSNLTGKTNATVDIGKTNKGLLQQAVSLSLADGKLNFTSESWKLDGTKVVLGNFRDSGFELKGKQYTFDFDKVNNKYIFTPFSRTTYDTSKTEDKQFLQNQKFNDVTGKAVTINTEQSKQVTFVYDISGKLSALEGGLIKVDGMQSGEVIVDEFGGLAVDNGFSAKGVVLTLESTNGAKTDLLLLNGNSVLSPKGVFTIESGQAVTLGDFNTGLKSQSKDSAVLLHISGLNGQGTGGTESSKNVIDVDIVNGELVVQKYQTINLENTAQGTQFVLKENDYLNNLNQDNSIAIVDVNNKQINVAADMQVHITLGSVETHSNGEIVDKNSYIGRAWNSLVDAKTWASTEEVNGNYRIINKVAGAGKAFAGMVGTALDTIVTSAWNYSVPKAIYNMVAPENSEIQDANVSDAPIELWIEGVNQMFNAGDLSRSATEISAWEMLGGAVAAPAAIGAAVGVALTGGAAISLVGAGSAAVSAAVTTGLQTMAWSVGICSATMVASKVVDLGMEQGWSLATFTTSEALWDIAGALGEGVKVGIYTGLLSMGISLTTASLTASLSETGIAAFSGTSKFATFVSKLGSPTGMFMLSSGLNVASFGAGFHVFGKALNSGMNLTGFSDSDAFLANSIRGMGQGTVEQSIVTGFAFGLIMGAPVMSQAMKVVEGFSAKAGNFISNNVQRGIRPVLAKSQTLSSFTNAVTAKGSAFAIRAYQAGTAFGVINAGGQAIQIARDNPDDFWSMDTLKSVGKQFGVGFGLGFAYAGITAGGKSLLKTFYNEFGSTTSTLLKSGGEKFKSLLSRTAQEITVEQTASSILQGAGVPQGLAEVIVEFLPGGSGGINISVYNSDSTGAIIANNKSNYGLRTALGEANIEQLAKVIPDFETKMDNLKVAFNIDDTIADSFNGKTLNQVTDIIVSRLSTSGSQNLERDVSITVANTLGVTVGAFTKAMQSQNADYDFDSSFETHNIELGTAVICEGMSIGKVSESRGLDTNYMSDNMTVSQVKEVLGETKSQELGLNDITNPNDLRLADVASQLKTENLIKVRVNLNQTSLRQYGIATKTSDIKQYAQERNLKIAPAIVGINMNSLTYFRATGVTVQEGIKLYNLDSAQGIDLIRTKIKQNSPAMFAKILTVETVQSLESMTDLESTAVVSQNIDDLVLAAGVSNAEELLYGANLTVKDLVALNANDTEQLSGFEQEFNVRISTADNILVAEQFDDPNLQETIQNMFNGQETINLRIFDSSNNIILEFENATRITVSPQEGFTKLEVTMGSVTTEYKIQHNAKTNEFKVIDSVVNVDGKSFKIQAIKENGNTFYRVDETSEDPHQVEQAKQINAIVQKLETVQTKNPANPWKLMERNGVNQLSKAIQLAFDKNTLWEIPAGTGKTFGIFYLASALANQVSGKKVIFVLHNAPLYNDIVNKYENDGELQKFYKTLNAGAGMLAMPFTQESLTTLQRGGQGAEVVKDQINKAGVVFMQADTWGFFALGAQQSAKTDPNAQVISDSFTEMFTNSKIIHDEVDTAFSKNRFQQGLNPRSLTPEEIEAANFVDNSLRNQEIFGVVIGKGEVGSDTKLKAANRLESERNFLMFKLQNRFDSKIIIPSISYADREAMDGKHNYEIIGIEFNQGAKQAIVNSLENSGKGLEGKIELNDGDIVAKAGVTLTDTQQTFLNNVKASMSGRAKVLRMYEGQDSGYDRNGSGQAGRDDKFLVKPFANMSLASSLQVGDPFIAAHSEIVFKDLLLSEIHEKATPEEKEQKAWNPLLHKVGVSGRAKVTAMNRAITMAMNMGADFSGFSGTVSSITQQAMAFYGVSSSLHNEGNIVSRMFNQSVNVQQKNSFESAMDGIIFEEGRVVTILNGLGGTDESSAKAEVIARAQKAEYTIIVKDQDTAWTVYTKADANSTEADASGYIVEENVPTEKIESYLETDKKANEGVLFYYNQSACRGTDTKLSSEEAKMIDRVGQKTGKVQVHAFFNAETTKTVAEQLLKRDRGLRLSVVETKNTNGDVIGYEVDTVKGNYQYMYRNIDTGEIVTEVMANNWADQESQRTGKTIKREAMFTEAFNDLTVNFIGASVKNTPDLLQIESGLAAQNNVSEEKAKEIVREFTPSTSLDIINTRLTEEVGPVESKLIIEKAQLQTLFVQNDVKAQKKMLLNGLMEIYDSVVTSHLEQLRDSDINIEEVKFIENLIIDFNNQTGVDTNIKMQNSAQSGVEALQKKIDGIIEFFQGKLENGSLEENLSSENYQQIQNIVTKTPALTFNADSIARKPKAIALSSTLAEAIISTNYYIQASQMPEIAPLSGESAVNIPAENWSEAAQSIEQQASDVAVNKIKDTLESKGHLVNGRLTQGGVLFINYLKQFMNASENMQTAVVEMAQGVGTEKVKAVDLPDDLVNKLAKALFALVGADIISLNVTSKSSAKKLMNTITGLQAFSGVIDLKEISTEDYQQALNSTDSTAIANLVLSNLGKDQNSDLFNSINVVAKKQDAINNNIDKLQRKIKYLQTRENQLYANYLGVSNQKTSETKTDSKDNILVRAYNNVSGSVSRTAKRAGIKFQLWSAHKQSEKAVQDLSAARINKIQTPVTVQDLTTVARQLGDTKLENVGSLALLFNSGMDTNNLDKANSTVAVFADMGMSSSIETLSFNNLIDFSTIDTETRGNIINGLVGESNVASFNEDLKTFKGDLLNSYQSDISANLISSIDKVKANFITGKEDSHLKLINWMAGSDFNQSAYYMAQASINSDMSETGAISDYKKVLDVKSDATLVQKAQASYSLGLIYFAQSENDTNSYDKAITNLENAAKYAAEDNQLTGLAADVYVKIGDINTEKAQQGIKSEGSNVSDSLSLAKTSYEKALELNAESIGAYFGLGRIDLVQSNYLDAQENFEACISLDKGQANHANMIGVAKALLNQTINAISIPDIAQVIDVNIGLAKKNIEAKEYGKAVDNYKKVLSLAKKMEQLGVESSELDAFVVGTNKDLAQVFKMKISQTESPREQQLIAEAIVDCYKAALEKDQQDPQLHYDLGIVYKAQGNVSKAKEAFQSADKLARSPDIKKAANVELEKINDMETFKQKADNVIADLDLAVTDLNNGYLENAKQGFEAVIEKSKSDSSLSGMIVGKLATTGENLISAKQFDKAILAFAMVDKAADNIAQDSSLVKDKISLKENIVLKQQTAKFGSVMQKVGEGVKNFDDGLYQEAADAFQQSIENAGNVTDNSGLQYVVAAAYFNRALSLLQTDDKDKATKAFDEFKQVVEDNNLQSSAALANGLITSNDITALIKVDDILANVNQNDERKGDQMGKAFAIDVDGRSFQIPVIGEKKGDNLEMSSMWEKDGSKISIPITGQLIGKDLNKSLQNIKTAALNLPEDQKIIVEAIIGFAEAKGINFLAANAADVMGFANGKGEIFVSEKLIDNKNSLVGSMAVFHEAGEAYFNANPELLPVGVSSHTYLRGCGKDVRNAMPKAIDSLAKKLEGQNRSAKPNEIVAEINSLLSGDKRVTSSEMALIDDNFLKGKNIQDWDKGLGDAVSSHGMIQLSDALINIKQDNLNEFSRADISSDKLPNPKLDKELLKTIDVDPSLKSMETFMMLDDLLNGKLVNEKKGVNTMLNSVQQFQKAAEML